MSARFSIFGRLNRLAGKIARDWWPQTGLRDDKMLRHNAVAHLLKPLLHANTVDWTRLDRVAPVNPGFDIQTAQYQSAQKAIVITPRQTPARQTPPNSSVYTLIFDDNCHIYGSATTTIPCAAITCPVTQDISAHFHLITLIAEPRGKKYRFKYAQHLEINPPKAENITKTPPIPPNRPEESAKKQTITAKGAFEHEETAPQNTVLS